MTLARPFGRWLATARDWVPAVERAYVEAAFAPAAPLPPQGDPAVDPVLAAAAAGAVASRFLAVGTPRSLGLIGEWTACALSLYAHRVWFSPTDIRCAGDDRGADELGGRIVSIEEALAADIVCIHLPLALAAAQLRRGTHVNALAGVELDRDLRERATIVDEPSGLPALAAGLRDGRQLDEITVFVAGDLAIARRGLAGLAGR